MTASQTAHHQFAKGLRTILGGVTNQGRDDRLGHPWARGPLTRHPPPGAATRHPSRCYLPLPPCHRAHVSPRGFAALTFALLVPPLPCRFLRLHRRTFQPHSRRALFLRSGLCLPAAGGTSLPDGQVLEGGGDDPGRRGPGAVDPRHRASAV